MMDGTYSNGFGNKPLTMETLKEAISKLKSTPKPDQWLLISPTGEAYQGTAEQVLPFLLKQHKLCQPLSFLQTDYIIEEKE